MNSKGFLPFILHEDAWSLRYYVFTPLNTSMANLPTCQHLLNQGNSTPLQRTRFLSLFDFVPRRTSSLRDLHCEGIDFFLCGDEISPDLIFKKNFNHREKEDPESSFEPKSVALRDARREVFSWVEAGGEDLRYLLAKSCPLVPSPRSTIAAAFSPDGKILASTDGDHTVKIINCQTGCCEKVLSVYSRFGALRLLGRESFTFLRRCEMEDILLEMDRILRQEENIIL